MKILACFVDKMNTQNIGFQSLGFHRNCNFQPAMEGLSPQENPGVAKSSSSNTIMSGFHTPTSAFYVAERCMGFPHHPSTSFISQHNFSFSICNDPFYGSDLCGNLGLNCFKGNSLEAYCNTIRAVVANKTRIRWTQDLHEKFMDCVKRLGGSESKGNSKDNSQTDGYPRITIFHVKSHLQVLILQLWFLISEFLSFRCDLCLILQKYRIANYMPNSAQGKSKERSTDLTQIDVKTGLHLTEALQLQLDVQRHLHEQLEFQQNLQLQIEEQGRQLQMMIDEQQKTSESLLKKQDFNITSFDSLGASISETSAMRSLLVQVRGASMLTEPKNKTFNKKGTNIMSRLHLTVGRLVTSILLTGHSPFEDWELDRTTNLGFTVFLVRGWCSIASLRRLSLVFDSMSMLEMYDIIEELGYGGKYKLYWKHPGNKQLYVHLEEDARESNRTVRTIDHVMEDSNHLDRIESNPHARTEEPVRTKESEPISSDEDSDYVVDNRFEDSEDDG
ncbi:hypothetical protein GQ457_08G016510 [Hibiscus cannabinus]